MFKHAPLLIKMDDLKFDIGLDNPSNIYRPGQLLSGRVILELKSQKCVEGLILKMEGQGKVLWRKPSTHRYSFRNGRNIAVVYHAEEKYLHETIELLANGLHILPTGQHSFNFTMSLPYTIPGTYKNLFASVEYSMEAVLSVSEGKRFCSVPVIVVNVLNLNCQPLVKDPVKKEAIKSLWLCCLSSSVHLSIFLPHTGYAPGQAIPLFIQMENGANISIKSVKCHLIQIMRLTAFTPYKKSRTLTCCLASKKLKGVPKNSTKTWNEYLDVPNIPISYLENCHIINITYELRIKAVPRGLHTNLILTVPVTMGNVPLNQADNEELVQL